MTKNGLIHIYCGDGKGKTTAAVGACRACGGEQESAFSSDSFSKAALHRKSVCWRESPVLQSAVLRSITDGMPI